ncbi:MAG: VTT domain-containing protein [Verrucomicrobiae bacterium]|nr:VTT domain-containing protein [Verrucomicrobiae bacterium]
MTQWIRRLHDASVRSLETPWALWVFALISFGNSIILPISPYFLLVPMCCAHPRRWLLYSVVCIVASTLGGYVMWGIGFYAWTGFESLAAQWWPSLNLSRVTELSRQYREGAFWTMVLAAASPVPYKVVALACGLGQVSLWDFTWATFLGRGVRLMATAAVVSYGGPRVRAMLEKILLQRKIKRVGESGPGPA